MAAGTQPGPWTLTLPILIDAIKAALQTLAVVVGAVWSFQLFVRKRQIYPRATVEHTVESWPAPHGFLCLRVSVRVINKGDVLLRLCNARADVYQILPWPEDVPLLPKPGQSELPWRAIGHTEIKFDADNIKDVEPGEAEHFTFDFVIEPARMVQAYSSFENVRRRRRFRPWRRRGSICWNTTTTHQITPVPQEPANHDLESAGRTETGTAAIRTPGDAALDTADAGHAAAGAPTPGTAAGDATGSPAPAERLREETAAMDKKKSNVTPLQGRERAIPNVQKPILPSTGNGNNRQGQPRVVPLVHSPVKKKK